MILSPYLAKSIAKRWPYRGRQRLAAWLGANVSRMPEGDIHVTPDGRKFKLRKDAMYLRLFLEEDFSREETQMFTHLAKAGDCIADVGANCGFYSVLFARQVGNAGHVHAFEPSPSTFEELLEHIALNDVAAIVTANCMALADKPQTRSLYTFPGRAHGLSSFVNVYNANATPTAVAALTLDDYMRSNSVAAFNLIKIDVEGAEWEVLRGAQQLLDSRQPPMLSIEMNDLTSKAFGYAPSELLRFLQDTHAYDIFQVFRHGYFISLTTLDDYRHGEMVLCAKSAAHADRLAELPRLMATNAHSVESKPASNISADERSAIERCPICGSFDHAFHHRAFDDRYGMSGSLTSGDAGVVVAISWPRISPLHP
jgi:FkbM family methyltransferase